jgi:hypothetical protein
MTNKLKIVIVIAIVSLLSCKSQQNSTTKSAVPKVENHLIGDLDYTHKVLELTQTQSNGEEISLGKIDKEGAIYFNLPEYDIKALFDSINLQHYNFYSWFSIGSDCKDRDVFAKTPFDDVYSQKTNAIWIKKYGIKVAILEAISDKIKVPNHDATQDSLAVLNTYYWFYIDRAITYKDECNKISHSSNETYATVNADISFEKGWNFIEENTMWDLNYDKSDPNSIQLKKTHFTKSTPTSNKVKWTLRQVADNAKIQTAKRLHNLTPLTKKQFEKWAPNKLGDLSVTTKEHGNPPEGQKNKNNIHLIYANEAQKREIDLYVVDCAKSPDDMEMINFAYAMENDGKDDKQKKPYITQYDKKENTTQLLYKVEDRITVSASGVNMNSEELWDYIKKLKTEKLIN